MFDSAIPYDMRFFESLNRIVQAEPWLERDRVMIDALKTIGIERGKSFDADERTRQVLADAMVEAKALLEERWATVQPFYDDGRWFFPVSTELQHSIRNGFTTPDSYPVGERGWLYTFIYFSAKHVGEAQYYLMAIDDADGRPLHGNTS